MDCEEKKTLLLNELERLNKLIGKDNWDIVRNPKNYILKQKKYKWGIRNFYKIPDENYNKYLDMQASRGIDDYRFEGIDNYIQKRIDEIKNSTKRTAADKNDNRYKEIKKLLIDTNRIDSLCEIGFRLPIVLEFYKNNEDLNVRGYDTVKSNVLLGQLLNYNVDYLDFNKMEEIKNLKISEKTCLVSYHCFEHLENPYESLQTLYSIMPRNSYLQIEIPIDHRHTDRH